MGITSNYQRKVSKEIINRFTVQKIRIWLSRANAYMAKGGKLTNCCRFILTFGFPFALYAMTLAPTVYLMDSAELTTAAATGGFVHPTGYPLYLVLGWLWTRIPIGDMGFRMNLFSAFNSALTIALIAQILRRLHVRDLAIWSTLGLLATGYYFWALSLIAEVYTLHTAMMAIMILLVLRWADAPTPQKLAWLGLSVGLSFGNHAATILLIPGLVFFIIVSRRKKLTPRSLLLASGAFALGLSIYLYLPIRYAARPAFNYLQHYDANGISHPINLQTFSGLWSVISGRAFQRLMLNDPNIWGSTINLAEQLARDFWFIGVGPALLGLLVLLKRNWRIGGMLLLMSVSHALFYICYQVPDKATMFLPNYIVGAIWIGVGLEYIFAALEEMKQTTTSIRCTWLLRFILSATVGLALAWNWPLVNLSGSYDARQEAEEILGRLEHNALILGHWDTIPTIEYLQLLEGKRPDVQAINRFLISTENMYGLIAKEIHRRPIYIDNVNFELLRRFDFTYEDGLYQLKSKEDSMPMRY
jgi:hypothetical protein